MSHVFVLDTDHRPLMPCTSARARLLLRRGKASVWRSVPFTIILKQRADAHGASALRLKLDSGSRTTGLAVVNDATGQVVFAAEITHRGEQVHEALTKRRTARRSRRQRHTRYRKPRFANRRRPKGWLPPSLESRLANIMTWVARVRGWCPITAISLELVKFDTALLQEPDLSGTAYQHGTLAGYELREYVLLKWQHACAYCTATNVPLELDHIVPRSHGGSDRESNLTLACRRCNQAKGSQSIEGFLQHRPEVLRRILAQLKTPLHDAAAINTMRWALYERLQAIGLPVETGSGGRTKWNRTTRGLPKTHWLDAAVVGASTPATLSIVGVRPLLITATGRGSRQQCRMDRHGFMRTGPKQARTVQGLRTGDLVESVVPGGKKVGRYRGRIAVRMTGWCNITTTHGTVQGIHARFCTLVQHGDGYRYEKGAECVLPIPSREQIFAPDGL